MLPYQKKPNQIIKLFSDVIVLLLIIKSLFKLKTTIETQ